MGYRGDISPGTWDFRFWYCKLNNLGIVKVEYSLDEGANWTTAIASLDQYDAAGAYTLFQDVAGVVVPAGKYTILVKCTSIGKNAASAASIPMMGEVTLTRTA